MRFNLRYIAIVIALAFASVPAHGGNQSQNTVTTKIVAVTIATLNTWQQVAKSDSQRAVMLCQNVATHSVGFVIMPMTNNNVAPPYTGIGSAGVFTMAAGVSYEADGGWMPGGEIWIIGTADDNFTCLLSPTQP